MVECFSWQGVLGTTLCDKVCQLLATGWWFSMVSFTNKTDHHDIILILLNVVLNTIAPYLCELISCLGEVYSFQLNVIKVVSYLW
jgi:hypothetical protein